MAKISKQKNDKIISFLSEMLRFSYDALSSYSLTLPKNLSRGFYSLKTNGSKFRILRFERIGDRSDALVDKFSNRFLSLDHLRKLFEILKRETDVVSIRDLVRRKVQGAESLKGTVALTFDGGFEEHRRLVLPLLKDFGFEAVFFLPTAFIGTKDLFLSQKIEVSLRVLDALGNGVPIFRAFDPKFTKIWKDVSESERIGDTRIELLLEYLRFAKSFRRSMLFEELQDWTANIPPPDLDRQFMNWEEVKEIANAGHVIGSLGHRGIDFGELTPELLGRNIRESFECFKDRDIKYTAIIAAPGNEPNQLQRQALRSWNVEIVLNGKEELLGKEDESWVLKRVTLNKRNSPTVGIALKNILRQLS